MKAQGLSSWFKGIKGRLLFAAVMPVVGFAIIFGISFRGLDSFNKMLTTVHTSIVPNLQSIGEMRQSRNKFSYQALAAMDAEDAETRSSRLKAAQEAVKEFKENYKKYTEAPFLDGEDKIHDKAKNHIPEFFALMDQIVTLIDNNDPVKHKEARALLYGKYTEVGGIIRDFNRDVSKLYDDVAHEQAKEAAATRTEVFNLVILVTALAA